MIDSRLLWSVLCEDGDRVVNWRNRVDCEAMCGLMSCDMKCMNVLCVTPLPFNMLCGKFFLKVSTSLKEKRDHLESLLLRFQTL